MAAYYFPLFKTFSFIFLIGGLALTQIIEEEKVPPNGPITNEELDKDDANFSIPSVYEQLFQKYDPLNTSFIARQNYFDLLVDILLTAGHEDGQTLTKRENELMKLSLERFVNDKKGDKFSYEEIVEDIDSKKMVQFVNEVFLEHFNEEYEGEEGEIFEEKREEKEKKNEESKGNPSENLNEDGEKNNQNENANTEENLYEKAVGEEKSNVNVNKNQEKMEL